MYDILQQFQVRASVGTVFDAFTSSSGLNAWWTAEATGTPNFDTVYRFYFGPAFDWRARVIHVVNRKELTWLVTEAMDDWLETEVGFVLEETAEGCLVRFFHRNWLHNRDHFAISTFCWGQLLNGLKQYVEIGKIVPFEKRN